MEDPDWEGATLNGQRRPWRNLTLDERLCLVTPEGQSPLVGLQSSGKPLLITGVSVEHRSGSDHHDTQSVATGESGRENAEQPGHTEEGEGEHAAEGAGAHTEQSGGESKETVLGVSVESPAMLAAMGAVSVALAALVWRRPVRPVAAVLAAFTVGAGVLDVAEVAHHVTENRTGLAALAGLIAALRLLTVAGTAALWRNPSRDGRPEEQQAGGKPGAPAVS